MLCARSGLAGTLFAWVAVACGAEPNPCGPARATVARVIDGDTVELEGGERVRYLLVDAPEITHGKNACFGAESREYNRSLVEGRRVDLLYEPRCRDRYDRLLAFVQLDGVDVNAALVRGGYACVLHIPPDGDARVGAFRSLEAQARTHAEGLWRACQTRPCGR